MGGRGAIAQLGERLDRTQEVGGSSPPSSISKGPAFRAFLLLGLAALLPECWFWSKFGAERVVPFLGSLLDPRLGAGAV